MGTKTCHRIAPQEVESGEELEAGAVAGRVDGDGLLQLLPRSQLPAADHELTGWSICSDSWVGGHSQMTSAVRGREGGGRFLMIGGGGCVISILRIQTRGEGVQNLENLADVIYEWPVKEI